MGIAKVTLNNETLMDITDDTVTASGLMLGDTAHGANGESVTGTYVPVTYDVATETTDGLMSASDKVKLNGVATGAEVNQNAFSNVKVGTTTIAADSKTDTLTLTAGTNITLTPNATSDSVTIAVNGMPSKVSDLDNDSGFITSSGTASNVSGTVEIEHGGTGATSASAARTNLGLGSAATASTSSTVGNNSSLPTGAAIQSYVTGLGYTTNTGTVTSVATGAGLTGGTITGSGTIKADIKSETKSSLTAASKGSTTNREYAVGLDANGDLSVNVPWENTQTITGVKGSSESSYRTGNVSISATNIGLGNVENKSSATIRGELTKSNVTTALGFTPYTQDEVNALVSSVFTYKGTKSTYAQVSTLIDMKTGDVWQVTEDNSEYVYNGSAWEKLGPTIDLSGYLTSVSVAGQSLTPGSSSITAEQLKTALGLGSAAYASTASSVGNNTNLPTGAAVQSYVTGLGYTTNTGTITEIKMNGSSKGTSGSVDLGTVLTAHQTIKQDGVTGATVNRFGTCGIAAGTAAKTVAITTGTFSLETGAKVTVKFTYANTASNPTLNVGGTGAKNIFHRGSRITTGTNKALLAGTCEFVYDGTQYHLIGNYYDTTYSSLDAASGGTSVSLVTTGEKYTWNQKTSNTGTVTSVATGTGLTGGPITTSGTISLDTSGVKAGSAGPTTAITGNDGTLVEIPRITVDDYGRVTELTSYNLTNKNTDTFPAAQCETAAATAAKVTTCTNYTLTANSYLHFNIRYANTAASALTMNVNSKGAKPIYINGRASSSSNYTLPAGSYIAFYDGTNWYFRTDGRIPGIGPYNEGLKLDKSGTVNNSAVLAAVTDNISLASGTYLVSSNCTINGQLIFAQGAKLNISSGVTVTIKGEITAGRYQIFDGDGSLVITNNVIYPEWFGAKNDGTTDSYDGIMKAFAAVQTGGEVSFAEGVPGAILTESTDLYGDQSTGVWTASSRCYKVSQAVQLTKGRVKLTGSGAHAVICSETPKIITIGDPTKSDDNKDSRIEQVLVKDFYFYSLITPPTSPSITTESQYAMTIAWTESSKFENLRIGGNTCGYYLRGNVGAYLEKLKCTPATNHHSLTGCAYYLNCDPRNWSNYMIGCSASMGGCLETAAVTTGDNKHPAWAETSYRGVTVAGTDTADLFFEHCEFIACNNAFMYTSNSSGTGIDVTLRGCTFDQTKNKIIGLYLNKTYGNIRFDTCYFQVEDNHSSDGAIFITGGSGSSVHFSNSWFSEADTTNWLIRSAENDNHVIIDSCTFGRHISNCISNGAGYMQISNCLFRDEDTTDFDTVIRDISTTNGNLILSNNRFISYAATCANAVTINSSNSVSAIGNYFSTKFTKHFSNSPEFAVNLQDNSIIPIHTIHSNNGTLFSESYKFDDGRLIINMRNTVTVSITNTSGNIYYGSVAAISWPIAFADKPTCTCSSEASSSNAFVWGQSGATTEKTPALWAGRGASNASAKIIVIYHAEGRWK